MQCSFTIILYINHSLARFILHTSLPKYATCLWYTLYQFDKKRLSNDLPVYPQSTKHCCPFLRSYLVFLSLRCECWCLHALLYRRIYDTVHAAVISLAKMDLPSLSPAPLSFLSTLYSPSHAVPPYLHVQRFGAILLFPVLTRTILGPSRAPVASCPIAMQDTVCILMSLVNRGRSHCQPGESLRAFQLPTGSLTIFTAVHSPLRSYITTPHSINYWGPVVFMIDAYACVFMHVW